MVVAALVFAVAVPGLGIAATTATADAQQPDCEDLPYNERITTSCIDNTVRERGSRAAGADADLDPLPGDEQADDASATAAADEGSDDASNESADAMDDEGAEVGSSDSSAIDDADAMDDAASDAESADDQGVVLAVESSESNLPIIAALSALTAVGAGLWFAARRNN